MERYLIDIANLGAAWRRHGLPAGERRKGFQDLDLGALHEAQPRRIRAVERKSGPLTRKLWGEES